MDIRKMSDEELIEFYMVLQDMISNVECYGIGDLRLLIAVEEELAKRGYVVRANAEVERE